MRCRLRNLVLKAIATNNAHNLCTDQDRRKVWKNVCMNRVKLIIQNLGGGKHSHRHNVPAESSANDHRINTSGHFGSKKNCLTWKKNEKDYLAILQYLNTFNNIFKNVFLK